MIDTNTDISNIWAGKVIWTKYFGITVPKFNKFNSDNHNIIYRFIIAIALKYVNYTRKKIGSPTLLFKIDYSVSTTKFLFDNSYVDNSKALILHITKYLLIFGSVDNVCIIFIILK